MTYEAFSGQQTFTILGLLFVKFVVDCSLYQKQIPIYASDSDKGPWPQNVTIIYLTIYMYQTLENRRVTSMIMSAGEFVLAANLRKCFVILDRLSFSPIRI